MSPSPVGIRLARAVPGLLREVDTAAEPPPLLLAGEADDVVRLLDALARGGDPSLLRVVHAGDLESEHVRGAALVLVVRGAATPGEERVLAAAERREIALVCLALDRPPGYVLPYVRATDVVSASAVSEVSAAAVARRVALASGEGAWALARGLPILRRPVAEALVHRFARQNGLIGAAVFVPGADLPALTLNQLRMVMRIGAAYGRELDGASRAVLGGVVLSGFGLRALARESVRLLPLPGFLVKAAIAGGATWLLGNAAVELAGRR
jgi:uncharacterized protein (DUF697 family)